MTANLFSAFCRKFSTPPRGICGTGLGILAAYIYARYSGWVFSLSAFALPLGAVISIDIGLFFGAYPAATAAHPRLGIEVNGVVAEGFGAGTQGSNLLIFF